MSPEEMLAGLEIEDAEASGTRRGRFKVVTPDGKWVAYDEGGGTMAVPGSAEYLQDPGPDGRFELVHPRHAPQKGTRTGTGTSPGGSA